MRRTIILLLLALLPGYPKGQVQNSVQDRLEPFAIEIPPVVTGMRRAVDGTDILIPAGTDVTRLRLWLLEPFSQRVNYSGFIANLNGESLRVIAKSKSGIDGKFLDIDLTLRPGLFKSGQKNVIEVQAREAETGIVYRATFVILTKQLLKQPETISKRQVECRSVTAPVEPGIPQSDPLPPRLEIESPLQPIEMESRDALRIRVKGRAVDSAGEQLTLKIGERIVAADSPNGSAKGSQNRAKNAQTNLNQSDSTVLFDEMVDVSGISNAVIVEVRDRHNNIGYCTIPVVRPAAVEPSGYSGRKFALLVGISEYASSDRGLNSLSFAHRDAIEIESFLKTPEGGQFNADDIVRLTDKSATLAAVRSSIERFLTVAGENDLIYLFLAGHGAPDPYDDPGNYYFLLHDSKVSQLKTTAYPMREIGEFLRTRSKKLRVVSFIDTCHSAGIDPPKPIRPENSRQQRPVEKRKASSLRRGIGQKDKPLPVSPVAPPANESQSSQFSFYAPQVFENRGWSVMTSASSLEQAQESPRWGGGHGVFTWAILKGLRDGAADRNEDCQITAGELGQYVRNLVSNETNQLQTPQILMGDSGEIVLATRKGCQK